MTNIRRYFRENDIVFITNVTYNRIPILIDNFDLLWNAIQKHIINESVELIAWSVLPDHFHLLLSSNNINISNLMRKIKLSFSGNYRVAHKMKSGRIWQYRFWDHVIRNQEDLNRHIDYIHYNPVKHKIVGNPIKWKYSSFHKYRSEGFYSDDWGVKEKLKFNFDFGE